MTTSTLKPAEVARLYHTGMSLLASDDVAGANEKFAAAARAGHADAAFQLAKFCRERDKEEDALHWALMAANRDHGEAQHLVATMYHHGHGTEKNLGRAMMWYTRAAAKGISESEVALAALRSCH